MAVLVSTSFVPLLFFCFNATATTVIYTLSYTTLFRSNPRQVERTIGLQVKVMESLAGTEPKDEANAAILLRDRKSTRLNSSHVRISYAVFCLKKKTTHCV